MLSLSIWSWCSNAPISRAVMSRCLTMFFPWSRWRRDRLLWCHYRRRNSGHKSTSISSRIRTKPEEQSCVPPLIVTPTAGALESLLLSLQDCTVPNICTSYDPEVSLKVGTYVTHKQLALASWAHFLLFMDGLYLCGNANKAIHNLWIFIVLGFGVLLEFPLAVMLE